MTDRRRHAPAYTILELLVVIALMVSVLAIGLSLYSTSTLSANGLSGATNQVSAALASARAVALRDSLDAAVFFSYNAADGCIHLRVVEFNGTTDPTFGMLFQDLTDQPSERLPNQVMIRIPTYTYYSSSGSPSNWLTNGPSGWLGPQGTLNATTGAPNPGPPPVPYTGGSPGVSAYLLAVWFGPDGTVRTSTPTGNTFIAYSPPGGAGPYLAAMPASVLLLYDNRDLLNAQYATTPNAQYPTLPGPQDVGDWLSTLNNGTINTARLLTFNRYSGILVRKQN